MMTSTQPRETIAEQGSGPSHPMNSSHVFSGLPALVQRTPRAAHVAPEGRAPVIAANVLRELLAALQFRSEATVQHSRRVAELALGIAKHLAWENRSLRTLEVAALLHDIGKLGVPDFVLQKPGPLGPEEADLVANNCRTGLTLLQACGVDSEVIEMIAQMQEGVPQEEAGRRGIAGQGARILAVADAYEALSSDQVYRKRLTHEQILKTLRESDREFDGNLVAALARWTEHGPPPQTSGCESNDLNDPPLGDAGAVRQAAQFGNLFSHLALLERLYDAYYVVDADLRFITWNRGSERLFGLPAARVLGQLYSRQIVPLLAADGRALQDDRLPIFLALSKMLPQFQPVALRPEGELNELEILSIPLMDDHGRIQGAVECYRDPTGARRDPDLYRELQRAASLDPLTGVANRNQLRKHLAQLHSAFESGATPYSVIFIDIDHFKKINDTYTHPVGDQVLKQTARILQRELYSGEVVARYGGEEFVIVCPETRLEVAVQRAERIRHALSEAAFDAAPQLNVTASFGVAEMEPEMAAEALLQRADEALFQAKRSGRNQTCWYEQPPADDSPETSGLQTGLEFHSEFIVSTGANIVAMKLRGFVEEAHAKVTIAKEDHVVLRMGEAGFLSRWGSTPDRRPVEVSLRLTNQDAVNNRGSRSRVQIEVCITPLGRRVKPDVFQQRAFHVMQALRDYLVPE